MTSTPSPDDLEALLGRTLAAIVGQEVRHVRLEGDALELYVAGAPSEERRVRIEIKAPWRIVDEGEILVGSLDAHRAGTHRLRKADVESRCRKLQGKKVTAFELLDFEIAFDGESSLEHFATATGEDEHFVTVEDTAFTNATYRLGFGWIEPLTS
jgi:hypothetical protein